MTMVSAAVAYDEAEAFDVVTGGGGGHLGATPGERERFERDGYVVIDRIASDEEVARIRATMLDLRDRQAGVAEGANFDALATREGGPQTFQQILNPHHYAPELLKTEFHAAATAVARRLLGPDAKLAANIFFMKPAGSGAATPWHQDEAFRDPAFDYQEVSVWLALQPVDEANSCMSFIPGSNHFPVLEHRSPGGDGRVHALECVGPFDRAAAVPCRLPAGGCSVHGQRTLHNAGPNQTDAPRLAWVLIFDRPPRPRAEKREFPWLANKDTPRMRRERAWRRKGGILIYAWRQRKRIGQIRDLSRLVFSLSRLPRVFRRPF